MKTIIILSGADRVGKSTMARQLESEDCRVVHHGPPPSDRPLFDDLRDDIRDWYSSSQPLMIWDRAYACSYALNQPNCLGAVLDFELEFKHLDIIHVGVERDWRAVARRHIQEISQECPEWDNISIREEYRERMDTHRRYYQRLHDFYDHITMFPVYWAQSAEELVRSDILGPHRFGRLEIKPI